MKKNLVIVSVLALALILSPFSGIGRGVFADDENTAVEVFSKSGNQSSDSNSSATPTPVPVSTPLPYDAPVEQIVDRVNEILDNGAAIEDPKLVSNQLFSKVITQQQKIGDAMRESVEIREKMAALETRYIEYYNIEMQGIEMNDAAKEVVDPDKVSIIGTAFDTGKSDVAMQWKMDAVDKELIYLPSHSKLVSLDVELYHDGEAQGNNTMYLPVLFTMPVPGGIDVDKLAIWHYMNDPKVGRPVRIPINFSVNPDGTISFSERNFLFSTFAFIETVSSSEPGSNTPASGEPGNNTPTGGESGSSAPSGGQSGDNNWLTDTESQITAAEPGTIVKITKDQNINTLSNSVMQQLVKRGDVALEMEYTYDGVDYHIIIPAGLAVDNDISWYGPLYLSAYYSCYAVNEDIAAPVSLYIVQSGDTLSRIARNHNTTVADLMAKNPQIKNANSIKPGQTITIE